MAVTLTVSDKTRLVVELSGTGPPVLFVHGTGGGLGTWTDVGARLTGYQLAYYARRNHAPSDVGPSPNSFAAEAADLHTVLAFLAERNGGRVHVVGGSYGATVALYAAVESTDRIASLTLFEPPLLLAGAQLLPVLDQFRQLCAAGHFDDALGLFAREVARVPPTVLAEAARQPAADPETSRSWAIAAGADLESMATDTGDTRRWASVDVPVLLMQGGQSWPPLPDGMDLLASDLPHARRVTFPDHSHFAPATAPVLVAETVQNFIDAA